jgi:2-polyprenyl-6-methoxyphenol hydroxylase-like FAD-dependent oxidoreductase
MPVPDETILVAGAGIGGLAVAAALADRGFDVAVFERADEVRGLEGSGLTIWGNAMTALARIGLADAVRRRSSPLERQLVMTAQGEVISDSPVGDLQRATGEVGVGVRRHDLLQALLRAAGGATVHYRRPVVDVVADDDGVTVGLDDGEKVRGAALIGADGLRSAVREHLLGDGPPSQLRHMVWRGISESRGPFPAETSLMVYGPGGIRMVGWPVDDGHVCWSLSRNGDAERVRAQPADIRDELLQVIEGFPEACRHVLGSTPAGRIIRTDLFARHDLRQLAFGRVALLGDAGHAMPTVFGQGAAMALEDAVVLVDAMERTPDDPASAFSAYERRRLPRLHWVRSQVFEVSQFQEWESPLLCALRNAFLRNLSETGSTAMWTTLMQFDDGTGSDELVGAP